MTMMLYLTLQLQTGGFGFGFMQYCETHDLIQNKPDNTFLRSRI